MAKICNKAFEFASGIRTYAAVLGCHFVCLENTYE